VTIRKSFANLRGLCVSRPWSGDRESARRFSTSIIDLIIDPD